jgi:hypothetical protein
MIENSEFSKTKFWDFLRRTSTISTEFVVIPVNIVIIEFSEFHAETT